MSRLPKLAPMASTLVRTPAGAAAAVGRRLGRASRRARVVVTSVAAVLVLTAAVAVTVLAPMALRADASQQATEAQELARGAAEQLLSYDAATLEQDLAESRSLVAREFAAEFENLVTTLIAPATRQSSLQTRASVERSAVVTAEPDRVEVLVFLTQETTRPGQEPVPSSSRGLVTVVHDGARWLVSGLSPV